MKDEDIRGARVWHLGVKMRGAGMPSAGTLDHAQHVAAVGRQGLLLY